MGTPRTDAAGNVEDTLRRNIVSPRKDLRIFESHAQHPPHSLLPSSSCNRLHRLHYGLATRTGE